MSYNAFTATDYIDALDQMIECMTSRHLSSVAVNAGGTGYAIGDILSIDNTGSTRTHDAKLEVTSVAAGVVDGVRVYRAGAYTVDPTTTTANASTADTGVGTGATFDLTMAAGLWSQLTRESEVDTMDSVAAGGTGYSVGDDLTLVGGVLAPGGAAATFNVDTLSGSAVATVSILTRGDYEVFPTDPVLTTVSPSGGTGCTLNLTARDTTGDTIVVLQGDAGSAIDPLIGIKTYSSETDETGANTVYNWALFGITAWASNLPLHEQANVSPGFSTAADGTITTSTTGDGAFVPMKDSDAFNIDCWLSVTGRRVVLKAKVEGVATVHYAAASFGLFNQAGVSTEVTFPAYVAGSSDRKRVWYRDTSSIFGGLTEIVRRANGPAFVWSPEGSWLEVKNALISGNQITTPTYNAGNTAPRVTCWPIGETNQHANSDDRTWAIAPALGFDNDDLTLVTSAIRIYRTPDTGGDLWPLFHASYVQADASSDFFRNFGEIDGVFWLDDAGAGISSEDRIEQAGSKFTIFQNGTRVEPFSYMALRED